MRRAAGDDASCPVTTGRVFGLAFLADGRLVSGGDDGVLRVWDTEYRASVETREGASANAITSIAIAPGGDRIATSSADGVVRVCSVDGLEPIAETPANR